MRLVWHTYDDKAFRAFCQALRSSGVNYTTEEVREGERQKFLLWIHDEDQVAYVEELLRRFPHEQGLPPPPPPMPAAASSASLQFLEGKLQSPIRPKPRQERRESFVKWGVARLTCALVIFCSCIFLLELFPDRDVEHMPVAVQQRLLAVSWIQRTFLFDYPRSAELLDTLVDLYGYQAITKPQNLPPAGKALYDQCAKAVTWPGIYPIAVERIEIARSHLPVPPEDVHAIPLFEKIRSGEIWRLITPIFLHHDILHIFFNMLWLLFLGPHMELRMGGLKYLLLIAIVAIISNTCQYLMTGPNFIGFSGVICGMATFTRERQRRAPWEGYPMSSATFHFIMFFIGTLACLSLLTFFLQIFQNIVLPIPIANTAHVSGACVGFLLGRTRLFAWRLPGR